MPQTLKRQESRETGALFPVLRWTAFGSRTILPVAQLPESAPREDGFTGKLSAGTTRQPTNNSTKMNRDGQIGLIAAALLGAAGVFSAQAQTSAPATPPVTNSPTAWKSSVAAGLTLTRGNSDTLLATVSAGTTKKWDQNELTLGADGAYGETKLPGASTETENADSLRGIVQYNRLVSDRIYFYGRVEGLHDGVADIQYRLTLAPGAGYYFIKNKITDLCAEVGPGFVAEKLGDDYSSFLTLRVGEKYHHQLSDRARIWQTAEFLPEVDRFSNYTFNGEIGIEADITADKECTLRSYLDDSYNNEPAKGRLKNDAKLVTAVAYKF
jgi:putative salt-induced outer membrane protein YdiY